MQRFALIREYSSRSMIPPPLCVIAYPYHLILQLHRLCKKDKSESPAEVFGEQITVVMRVDLVMSNSEHL